MDNQTGLAETIGRLLGKGIVGAATLPFKVTRAVNEFGQAMGKRAGEVGMEYGKGFAGGITTPVAQHQYTPTPEETFAGYLGRVGGQSQRGYAKYMTQDVPRAAFNVLKNVGEQEVNLAKGIGQGFSQTPEVQQVQRNVAGLLPQQNPYQQYMAQIQPSLEFVQYVTGNANPTSNDWSIAQNEWMRLTDAEKMKYGITPMAKAREKVTGKKAQPTGINEIAQRYKQTVAAQLQGL
jgi:hypothetical protein